MIWLHLLYHLIYVQTILNSIISSKGCKITELYKLLQNSASSWYNVLDESINSGPLQIYNFLTNLTQVEDSTEDLRLLQSYLWRLLVNQADLEFYEFKQSTSDKLPCTSAKASKAATKTPARKKAPGNKLI